MECKQKSNVIQGQVNIDIQNIDQHIKIAIINEGMCKLNMKVQNQLSKLKQQHDNYTKLKNKYQTMISQFQTYKNHYQLQQFNTKTQFQKYIQTQKSKLQKQNHQLNQLQTTKYQARKDKQLIIQLQKQIQSYQKQIKKIHQKYQLQIQKYKQTILNQSSQIHQLNSKLQLFHIPPKNQPKQLPPNKNPSKIIDIQSFIQSQSFTLQSLQKQYYSFHYNIYYHSYQQFIKSNPSISSQHTTQQKIIRTYKTSQIQHQYPEKFKKTIFKNGYSIVHYKNGDIRQTLPLGTQIYYDKVNDISEFMVGVNKRIINKNGIIEMNVQNEKGTINQIWDKDILRRRYENGKTQIYKNGELIQIDKQNNIKNIYKQNTKQTRYPKNYKPL